MQPLLNIRNLVVRIGDRRILNGVSLTVLPGETHVIMGPNGSGKSTLVNAVMGNPHGNVESGEIIFDGSDVTQETPEARAGRGIFLAFQYPREISGVQLDRFLFTAYQSLAALRGEKGTLSIFEFNEALRREMEVLKIKPEFAQRSLNEGFSGGEKKKVEMLQMAMLQPKLVLMDETDSGLDVDALRIVGEAANRFKTTGRSLIVVTHYNRILQYVQPDFVHVMAEGTIVRSGGKELIKQIEEKGFAKL